MALSFNPDVTIARWQKKHGVKNPKKLNLGAGLDVRKGWTNHDQVPGDNVHIVCDLNKFPYPIKDKSYDVIYMAHVLEHLDNPIAVLNELHRVLKDNGLLIIRVPHYAGNSNWIDLTHRRPYSALTLKPLSDKVHCRFYGIKTYSQVDARFGFWKFWYYPWNYLVEPFANRMPIYYENVFANLFPPFEVVYILRK